MTKNKFFLVTLFILGISNFLYASSVQKIGSEEEFNNIIGAGKPVVADFFATWCPPCKMLAPILSELAGEYEGKITFVKIDVDKHNDIASKYKISGIPDVRIFKNGKQEKQLVGLRSKKDYKEILDSLL